MPIDEDAKERLTALEGARGDDVQFAATLARQKEVIDQRFDLFRFISGEGATVLGAQQSLISATE